MSVINYESRNFQTSPIQYYIVLMGGAIGALLVLGACCAGTYLLATANNPQVNNNRGTLRRCAFFTFGAGVVISGAAQTLSNSMHR